MSDYSSSALGDQMGRILDNAIRRYVTEFQWYGTPDEGFQGNGWDGLLPPTFGPTGTVRLRQNAMAQTSVSPPPPGSHYVGEEIVGQLIYYIYEIDAYEVLYKPWIDRLNTAFEGWRSLPDPADFVGPRTSLEGAVDALTPEAQSEGGFSFVDVEVSNAMGLMYKWISPSGGSSSDLLYAFDAAYGVDRITGVMMNQAQVAAGAGLAVAGEQQVWTKARADIMRIAGDAADALDVSGGGGGSIDLGVVKAFVDLTALFVPAQYKILTGAVSQGLGFLDQVIPEQTVESRQVSVAGGSAEEIFASLETAIRDLESAVFHEEVEIGLKLQVLLGIMGSRAASDFHLHPGAGTEETFTDAAVIRIESTTVQSIGTRDVPTVATAFLRAADLASTHTGQGIWSRDHHIGYGSYGPWARWSEVLGQLDAITTGSARELVEAGQVLAVAAGWIEDSDDEAAAALSGLTDDLARGRTHWNFS